MRQSSHRLRHGSAQHIPQDDHEQIRAMDEADGASGPARVSLLAARASVALDVGACAAPFLALIVVAERAPVFSVCPRFYLRNRLRLSSKIPNLSLGVLDLGRIQFVESIDRTAKVVV